MAYPAKINALVDIAGTSTLAVVGHAARHNDLNDALDELAVVLTVPAANTLALAPGGTERLRIDSSGNVGIGTTGAASKLQVNGAAAFDAGTALLPGITTTGDLNTGVLFPAADTVAVSTDGTERLRIDSSGNVGIGTTGAASKFEVNGAAAFAAGTAALPGITTTGDLNTGVLFPAADTVAVSTGGTEKMRIDSAGLISGSGTSLGAWTAWTPAFTGFTVGNATLDFAYSKIGKTVHLRGSMIFGSTSTMTGPFDLTLPFNLSSGYTFIQNIGRLTVYDVGASVYFGDLVKISGGTGGNTVRCVLNLASGTTVANQEISATAPMTWVTDDVLFINGTFESE